MPNSFSKIPRRLLIGVATVLLLLLAALFVLNFVVQREDFHRRIEAAVSRRLGGEFEFQRIGLSFWPRPRVRVHRCRITLPPQTAGTVESVTVSPDILPLLTGRLRVTKIKLAGPAFTIAPGPPKAAPADIPREPIGLEDLDAQIAGLWALVRTHAPDLVVELNDGQLELSLEGAPVLGFKAIQARLNADVPQIELACTSDFWERLDLKVQVDPSTFKGQGHVRLSGAKPFPLVQRFLPERWRGTTGDGLDLDLTFQSERLQVTQATVEASLSKLELVSGTRRFSIGGIHLAGDLKGEGPKKTFALRSLQMDAPRLELAGALRIDPSLPPAESPVQLELAGGPIDVGALRDAALALAADVPVVGEIFDVLRGGEIPALSLTTHGQDFNDLENPENLALRADLRAGRVRIPDFPDVLSEVQGSVTLAQGILQGKDLSARMGETRASNAVLKLGFGGPDPPFHLDAHVEGDLAQVHELLRGLVKTGPFAKELERIEKPRGTAAGRLVLGESLKGLQARGEITRVELAARYQAIPFPLKISGGPVAWDATAVTLQDLDVTAAGSAVTRLAGTVNWGKAGHISLQAGPTVLVLAEIHPWLASLEPLRRQLNAIQSLQGKLHFSALAFKGPLADPGQWSFQTSGKAEAVNLKTAWLPDTIVIAEGRFKADTRQVSFERVQAAFLDATLNASGVCSGYVKGVPRVELKMEGRIGPQAAQWLSQQARLPDGLQLAPPLTLAETRLSWDAGGHASLSGKLTQQAGPEISAAVTRSPGEVKIDSLVIRDEASRANFTAAWAGGTLDLTFSGSLHEKTLNRLWAKNNYLTGELSGDLKARISLETPLDTALAGYLQGAGLRLPLERPAGPITVERFALKAEGQKVVIEPGTHLTWAGSRLDVSGSVESAAGRLRLDLDVAADVLDGTAIARAVETKEVKVDPQPGKIGQRLPMAGTVRFKAREVTYDPYTVKPLAADITFDGDHVDVQISRADLCGISLPGWVKITPGEIAFDFKPAAQNREIDPTIDCLGRKGSDIVGRFDVNGHVHAQGPAETLIDALRGELELTAPAGRVRRSLVLDKLLRVLNTTEVLVGKMPDLSAEGFTYESAHVSAVIEGSRLKVHEYFVDGTSMKITGQGTIDLRTRQLDATALVAPLKTADRVLSKLPLIGYLFGGSLVSIPIKISGDLDSPKVDLMDPTLVGTGLLEMTKRALKLPFEILKPIAPPSARESQGSSP